MYSRQVLRVFHRAVGVGCLGSLLLACSPEGPQRLSWEVAFPCPADALATEQLTFRVLKGGCAGTEVLYEETLIRGGSLPSKKLDPGSYGLSAVASGAAGMVAQTCAEHELPANEAIELSLHSESCTVLDAGVADAAPPCMPPMDCRPCAQDGDLADCPPTSCTEQTLGGHSYLFCSDKQQWPGARTECRKLGRDLAIIETVDENAFITTQIAGSIHWIGANDRGNNGLGSCRKSGDEGTWRWVNPASGTDQGSNFCNASTQSTTGSTSMVTAPFPLPH